MEFSAYRILFWTDTERKVIETSHTNGQSRTVIASRAIYHPVGLAVDIDTETLYWTDAMYHTIERCSYEGHKRFTVISRVRATKCREIDQLHCKQI